MDITEEMRQRITQLGTTKPIKFPFDFRVNEEYVIRCFPYELSSSLGGTLQSQGYIIPHREDETIEELEEKIGYLQADCNDVQLLSEYDNFEELIAIATQARLLCAIEIIK